MKMAKDMQSFEGQPQEEQRGFISRENSLDRNLQRELAGMRTMQALTEADAKQRQDLAKIAIKGFKTGTNVQIREADAENLRKGVGSVFSSVDGIDRVLQLTKTDAPLVSTDRAKAAAAIKGVLVGAKNAFELGALTSADIELIQGMLPDIEGMGRTFSLDAKMRARLQETQRIMAQQVVTRLAVSGYEPEKETLARLKINPNDFKRIMRGMEDQDMNSRPSTTPQFIEQPTFNRQTGTYDIIVYDPATGKPIGKK
jgi:hypothetical protein